MPTCPLKYVIGELLELIGTLQIVQGKGSANNFEMA